MDGNVRLDDLISAIKSRHPDGDPLGQLSDAVTLGEHLGEVADHLIGHFVDRARNSGASWTEIGHSMGVTKQAVQKRFVPKEGTTLADDLRNYSRYTPRAREALVQAQAEARAAGSSHITPEHLVLGLVHLREALAAKAMATLGADLDVLKEAITGGFPPAPDGASDLIPFNAPSKKVLELTLREALRLGHNYVGTEHILLGVLSLQDEPVVTLLASMDVTKEGAEREIIKMLHKLTG